MGTCWWKVIFVLSSISLSIAFEYKKEKFAVPLDHFSFVSNETFSIRYLINETYSANNPSAPILFYTGNEGDIELFAQNTGLMWDFAEKLGATLVFAEHRYYGQSLPFGNNSYDSPQHLGFLSSEQALADFSLLLEYLNPSTFSLAKKKRPVIAFGGSYGGMLSAWLRMKYPHVVVGAIASSAPIFQFTNLTACDAFNRILTSVFATAFPGNSFCPSNVRKSWDVMRQVNNNLKSASPEGRTTLNRNFKFCKGLNTTDDLAKFEDYLSDVYGNIAMMNYPYSTNFIANLPGYPVRAFCNNLRKSLNDTELIEALQLSLSIYSNSTGKAKCLDIDSSYDSNLGDEGWDFQSCTEMVMPMCSNGKTDMFQPKAWDFDAFSNNCFKKFGVRPRLQQAIVNYGGFDLDGASNIFFSNGLLDPWSGGGVLRSPNDKIKIMIIPESAHHLDLRSANPADPTSVIEARMYEFNTIKDWIKSHWE
ncbi:Lysosomal Pro-X carboxypeptidase [Pseudolycoriella hygida]|uniref:Lysosomal Pro-X carboxypeptidase n=1 Tax=Pseudolycoriella hygida TaxID=35572 RepID=A0A9Q0MV76_9DIPT|nr:Lysosomal Pro-X carboxypeptidase [Pseudolycoriella hygida]